MFANAAKMEKHFQPAQHAPEGCFDSFHCLHFARLNMEARFFLILKYTQTLLFHSVMVWPAVAPLLIQEKLPNVAL